jgi:GNAT superfamily N-acetyltransferase
VIRPARTDDIPRIVAIEIASGEPFRDIGMISVADDAPPTPKELTDFIGDGLAIVDTDESDSPIGYILFDALIDSRLFVEQVTIDPRQARRGIGARLLERGSDIARDLGLAGLSLTTFRDVPWNAQYYARLGFVILSENSWSRGLESRMEAEAARGLDAWPRVVMVRHN